MKAKGILAVALALVLALGMLSACSGTGGGETTAAPVSGTTAAPAGGGEETTPAPEGGDASAYEVKEPIAIEFWYNGSANESFYNEITEEFNQSQDLITVTSICVGGYPAIQEQIAGAQAAGTGLPGLCAMNAAALPAYVDSGVTEPLDPYLAAFGVDVSDFIPGFMAQAEFDGQIHALPHGPSAAVYFYNKTALAAHGLDTFPTTWEEFKTWAKDVYEATGKPAFSISYHDGNPIYNMILNFGGQLITDEGTSDLSNDTVKGYFKELKELVDAGYISYDLESGGMDLSAFQSGDLMSCNDSCTQYSSLITSDFEVGIGWNFTAETGYSTVGGSYLFIPAEISQEEKNAAFQFLNYLTGADMNLRWAEFSSYIPTHTSTVEDNSKVGSILESFPENEVVYSNSEQIMPKVKSPYYSSAIKVFFDNLSTIFVENADFDSTWDSMVEEIDYILAGN